MKKFLITLALTLFSFLAQANGIDDKCPTLTYKSAPVATADQYLCRTEYAVAFSYKTKNPVYTTELLTAKHTGDLPRTNDFRPDKDVPLQYRVTPGDYTNSTCYSGRCDRGHMTPDQDFSACAICVSESFLMTNMVPQNFKNNEVIWKFMETKIRKYVATGHDVFVITGPVYGANPSTIGSNKVLVPERLFKVMIDAKTGKSIAFLMKNDALLSTDLPSTVVNLEEIETAASIKFDSSLDKKFVSKLSDWQL